MPEVSEGGETVSVKLTVAQHYQFRSEAPEQFDWERVINPKVGGLGVIIARDIMDREAEWTLSGRNGSDPIIPGLREALRLIARTAVWRVQSERRAAVLEAARLGLNYARALPDGARSAA
jgi:hypothetical protein